MPASALSRPLPAPSVTTKRLLIVEDESSDLELHRILAPLNSDWELEFVKTGKAALAALHDHPYDAVLTDVMIGDLEGADLLTEVKERLPHAVRIIFSAPTHPESAVKCIGIAHHCLAKPASAETFKDVIQKITEPEIALRNEKVARLVGQLRHLPTLPALYSRIVHLLDNPHTEMRDIGRLISGDMGMTAKILQIVNSPFFGMTQRITSPTEAAAYLGMDTLKALVLAANVFDQYETARFPRGFSAAQVAEHSQTVAAAARVVARVEDASRRLMEESLVAGLLHDVGLLLLASGMPEPFEDGTIRSASYSAQAEQAAFGATHSEVGAYLLGLWGLPEAVTDAIRFHHSPRQSPHQRFSALTAVHVAECLITDRTLQTADRQYFVQLGRSHRLPLWAEAIHEIFMEEGK